MEAIHGGLNVGQILGLRSSLALARFTLPQSQLGRNLYYSHGRDKETQVQRGEVIRPRSHS